MVCPQILRHMIHHFPEPHRFSSADTRPQIVLRPHLRNCNKPFFIPLRAWTVLPSLTANETEFRAAMARHVVTSVVQVDNGEASGTGLPPDLTCKSTQLVDSFVLPARITWVGWLATSCASLGVAMGATNIWVTHRTRFA
jgi:hypothetical protein